MNNEINLKSENLDFEEFETILYNFITKISKYTENLQDSKFELNLKSKTIYNEDFNKLMKSLNKIHETIKIADLYCKKNDIKIKQKTKSHDDFRKKIEIYETQLDKIIKNCILFLKTEQDI